MSLELPSKYNPFITEHECVLLDNDGDYVDHTFITKSRYRGFYNMFGMNGLGRYTLPNDNGAVYEGQTCDGQFHGYGRLLYPNGVIVYGRWWCGRFIQGKVLLDEGSLVYDEKQFKYLTDDDRRYTIEKKNGLQAAGQSYITNNETTPVVPEGMYDTSDGFFCPKHKVIYDYQDQHKIVRVPLPEECDWIVKYCRSSGNESNGPQQDLYETWYIPTVTVNTKDFTRNKVTNLHSTIQMNIKDDEDIKLKIFDVIHKSVT